MDIKHWRVSFIQGSHAIDSAVDAVIPVKALRELIRGYVEWFRFDRGFHSKEFKTSEDDPCAFCEHESRSKGAWYYRCAHCKPLISLFFYSHLLFSKVGDETCSFCSMTPRHRAQFVDDFRGHGNPSPLDIYFCDIHFSDIQDLLSLRKRKNSLPIYYLL